MKPRYLMNEYAFFVLWLLPTFSAPPLASPFQAHTFTSTHTLEVSTASSSFWFVDVAFLYYSMLLLSNPSLIQWNTAHISQLPKDPQRFIPLLSAQFDMVLSWSFLLRMGLYHIHLCSMKSEAKCPGYSKQPAHVCSVTTLLMVNPGIEFKVTQCSPVLLCVGQCSRS